MAEPFIPKSDRPDLKVDPEKSLGELTVLELQTILSGPEVYKFRKDKEHFLGEKLQKEVLKEHYYDKFTDRYEAEPGGSGMAQLLEHVGGLHKKIDDLADQVAELKKSK